MSHGLDVTAVSRLLTLRARTFRAIKAYFAESEDGHCKSYEGTYSIVFPNYFEEQDGEDTLEQWAVSLDMYVIGPSRHYTWTGRSLSEAVDRAEHEVSTWLAYYEEPAA